MVDERDIHGKKQSVKRIVERIKEDPEICPENKEKILEFNQYLKSVRRVKIDRREFYLNKLLNLARWAKKPFKDMEKDDVKKIQVRIEEKEDYTEWTKHDYLLGLRKFFQWLKFRGEDDYSWKSKRYPPIVNDIDVSVGKDARRLPKNLPEKEEVEKMLAVCKNSRDKAILMTLFDGGFRAGEFLNMKVGDLSQMSSGISIVVHGKTGSKQVLMPMAEPFLNKWLEDHPDPSNESYLWVNVSNHNYGDPLAYKSLRKRLIILKKRAELSCKVNPHAFRKASASFYAQHLNEVQMCDRYGWVYGSEMPRIYIKKSGKRTNNAVLKAHGMKVEEEEKDETLKPRECNRCGTSNPYDSKKCRNCGMLLDKSKVTEDYISEDKFENKFLEMIEKDPKKWGSVFLNALEETKAKATDNGAEG